MVVISYGARDLKTGIGLSASATSRLVVKLETEDGLVRREVCQEDNQALYVVLRAKGKKLLAKLEAKLDQILANHF